MNYSDAKLRETVTHGQMYFPATNHYSHFCVVACDRCNKTNLDICIGYEKIDLCLPCAEKVANDINNSRYTYHGGDLTLMESYKFYDNRDCDRTFMMSDKFCRK